MHRGAYRAGTVKTKGEAEMQLKCGNTYISHAYDPTQSPSYQACTRLCTAHSHFAKGDCRLPRHRGNVVTAPWQRCYGPVATLLWARGNVDMGPWQRTKPYVQTLTSLIKGGTRGLKPRKETEGRNGLIDFIPRVHPCTFRSRSFWQKQRTANAGDNFTRFTF